jgi:hypothetical protein
LAGGERNCFAKAEGDCKKTCGERVCYTDCGGGGGEGFEHKNWKYLILGVRHACHNLLSKLGTRWEKMHVAINRYNLSIG